MTVRVPVYELRPAPLGNEVIRWIEFPITEAARMTDAGPVHPTGPDPAPEADTTSNLDA